MTDTNEVKLAGALPKSMEANGLTAIRDELVDCPTDTHVVIAVIDCAKVTNNIDTGETIPTARILRLEVVSRPEDRARLGQLASRAFNDRTGQTTLPLDVEDEIRAIFGGGESPPDERDF